MAEHPSEATEISERHALADVHLDDKYTLQEGRIFLTGTQALVRLPLMQRARDADAGIKTGGFISGYRGSPLGALDQQLWKARKFLAEEMCIRDSPWTPMSP